jgi:hypothetical protein
VNRGKVIHELHLILLKKETTSKAVMAAINTNAPIKSLVEMGVGILMALPRRPSTSVLSAELLPGRDYLVICRFQDNDTTPVHSQLGMVSFIHVIAGDTLPVRPIRTDSIRATDYAFTTGPTITAGAHTLTFVNAGKQKHELNIALLKRGVSTATALELTKSDGDFRPVVDEWIGVLFAEPGESSVGSLRVTLLPGREYLIKCDLTDNPGAPGHVHLGMFGVIRAVKGTKQAPIDYAPRAAVRSGNPILPGWYADPEAHVFDGQYWIFPTYSAPYAEQTFLDAFSSRDYTLRMLSVGFDGRLTPMSAAFALSRLHLGPSDGSFP